MTDKQAVFVRQSGSPVEQDRCTITITAHYQEWDPPQITHIRHAFDYLEDPASVPHQGTIRVNVGSRVEIPLGTSEPGNCVMVLEHQLAKISKQSDAKDILQKAQESNIITLTNDDGVVLGLLLPNRSCVCHFPGKVYAQASSATALLHVSVMPANVRTSLFSV